MIPHTIVNTTLMKKERILSIDVAKGLCILQVVLFHTLIPYIGTGYFVSISLPTFILISGFFFKNEIRVFFRSIDKLLIPYITTFILFNIMYFLIEKKFVIPRSIWFLYVLFMCTSIYLIMSKLFRRLSILSIIVVFCSLGGFLIDKKYNFPPFQIGSILTSILFFHVGHMLAYYKKHLWNNRPFCLICVAISIGACIYYYNDGDFVFIYSLCINHYEINWLTSMVVIFSGIFSVLYIAKLIEKSKVLRYLGRYSLIILCFHIFILYFNNTYIGTIIILASTPIFIFIIKNTIPSLYGLSPSLGTLLMQRYKNKS